MNRSKMKIADLGQVVTGKTPPTKQTEYFNGEYPFITPSDLNYDSYRAFDTATTVTEKSRKKFKNQFLPANAITFTCIASVGKIGITTKDSLTNQQINSIIVNKRNDWRFVYYLLRNESSRIRGMCSGVATPIINKSDFEKVEVEIPDLLVQRRIAAILSAYDDLIENNRRRIHLLEEAARLLYREWFVHLRFPGHERVSVIDGVPEGWERVSLGDVLMLQRGFDLPSQDRIPGEVPIYASTGVTGYHTQSKVAGPGVTTGRSGSLGTVLYIPCDFWPLNTTLWVKEFKKVPPIYASHLLAGLHLERYNGGAAVPTLNRNDAHKIEILQPVADLLAQFTQIAKPLYEQMRIIEQYNTKLAQARDLLLPRLMNGEIQL